MRAATRIHSGSLPAKETLQEFIQRFTDLVIHAAGTDPTVAI